MSIPLLLFVSCLEIKFRHLDANVAFTPWNFDPRDVLNRAIKTPSRCKKKYFNAYSL